MTRGIDTTFMVQLAIKESAGHEQARTYLSQHVLDAGHTLALAPQVLAEFVHVVTDPRRFRRPLPVDTALGLADHWWRAAEVRQVFPDAAAVTLFVHWMDRYGLGRKRILDTLLAATYAAAGIRQVISTNARDYGVFEEIEALNPAAVEPG